MMPPTTDMQHPEFEVMPCLADYPPHDAHEWDFCSDEILWCPGVGRG